MLTVDLARTAEARFWAKVERGPTEECWEWRAAKDSKGYGLIGVGRRPRRAHRVSWLLAGRDIGDLCVLHRCDNPSCVNPAHLFLGTVKDNSDDKVRKGRQARGDTIARSRIGDLHWTHRRPEWVRRGFSNPHVLRGSLSPLAKLNENDVRLIRADPRQGKVLADEYGVSRATISMIRSRKIWAHVV